MTNLVPERRTDKRGITSTRWVKPLGATTATTSTIPSPAVAARPQSPDVHKIIHSLYIRRMSAGDEMKIKANVKFLSAKRPDLMDRIVAACEDEEGEERLIWLSRLLNGSIVPTRAKNEDEAIADIERALTVYPMTLKVAQGRVHDSWYTAYMSGYDAIVKVMVEKSGRQATTDEMKAMVLGAFCCLVHPSEDDSVDARAAADVYEKIKDDITYIADHQEEVERAVDVFRERRVSYSSDIVRGLADNKSAAMIDGVL